MITLINPPGIKTFSGLQMHTPNPPLGLAYIAGALKQAGLPYRVIDATGEALDAVSPYPDRSDFMASSLMCFSMGVSTTPGATEPTRTPLSANSRAQVRVQASRPAFEAE